jgi:hypothetical protein
VQLHDRKYGFRRRRNTIDASLNRASLYIRTGAYNSTYILSSRKKRLQRQLPGVSLFSPSRRYPEPDVEPNQTHVWTATGCMNVNVCRFTMFSRIRTSRIRTRTPSIPQSFQHLRNQPPSRTASCNVTPTYEHLSGNHHGHWLPRPVQMTSCHGLRLAVL